VVNREPHLATLLYTMPGTYGTNRIYHEGVETSIVYHCLVSPAGHRLIRNDDGDVINAKWQIIIHQPLSLPKTATKKIQFAGTEYRILSLVTYSKHTEIYT